MKSPHARMLRARIRLPISANARSIYIRGGEEGRQREGGGGIKPREIRAIFVRMQKRTAER